MSGKLLYFSSGDRDPCVAARRWEATNRDARIDQRPPRCTECAERHRWRWWRRVTFLLLLAAVLLTTI